MLYFGRVGSLWGLCAKVGSSWGENVITPFGCVIIDEIGLNSLIG
jgi:hypothetical protein